MSAGMTAFGIILLLILSLFVVFNFYGTEIRKKLATRYPPPGKLIDVGGYHLHINCQGFKQSNNTPTIVLEASDFSLGWALVQPEVAKFAKVCSYDRAGLGWSERSQNPRTVDNIVKELHLLLEKAEVKPPYVLVGHSKSGLFVRLFAHNYPTEVAGMVLVDSAHEEQEIRFPRTITRINQQSRKQTVWMMSLIRRLKLIGLLTPVIKKNSDKLFGAVPEKVREMSLAFVLSDKFLETVAEETNSLDDDFTYVRDEKIKRLGEIPLIVLTATDQFAYLENHVPSEDIVNLKRVVDELQSELVSMSSNGKQVKVKESGHHIHVDRPQVVVNAIREVVNAIQN